jgi:leucyl aminopeptidase
MQQLQSPASQVFIARGRESLTVPITFVTAPTWEKRRAQLDARARSFADADAAGFEAKAGRHLLLPGEGGLAGVLFGLEPAEDPVKDLLRPGALPALIPPGHYRFANPPHDARLAALAFALGCYGFTHYRKQDAKREGAQARAPRQR